MPRPRQRPEGGLPALSRNTSPLCDGISKRFLHDRHVTSSSTRIRWSLLLANSARSRSLAPGGNWAFFVRRNHLIE
jgi:hypothetical protein